MSETPPPPAAAAPPGRAPLLLGLAAAAACLGFAAFTGHIWEDYFITFRASLNLATGHGLVYQPGERVHSFTSPLGTLLPALFALGGGDDVAVRALWGLRLVSAAALGGAVWLAVRAFRRDGLAPFAAITTAVAWLLDPKTVDFSINGMETALVVLGVTLAWHAFTTGARLWPTVLACAGLQWTRPDGGVIFAALAGAWLLLADPVTGEPRGLRAGRLGRAIAVAVALYLPWFLFAWWYYGSPVPHTIIAKAVGGHDAAALLQHALSPWYLLFGTVLLQDLFQPAYYFFGGWPEALHWLSRIVVLGAAWAWVWPRVPHAGRVASLGLFLGQYYVNYLPPFPWYYPAWQALALLSWAYLLHTCWQVAAGTEGRWRWLGRPVRTLALVFVVVQAGQFVAVAWQMRTQQTLIENEHRRVIGQWLRREARPDDKVFVECLGYIGYYSGLKMLDHPGLSAPEVVAVRKSGRTQWAQIIEALRPEWVVLRPGEARQAFADVPALQREYTLARTFDTRAALDAIPLLPGRGYLNFDAIFLVYRRAATTPSAR